MKDKVNILLTSVGVATGPNVINSLRRPSEYNINIIGTDCDDLAAGLYLADQKFILPKINAPDYISGILNICTKEKINIVIPLLSKEILLFAQSKKLFDERNIKVAIPETDTVELCNNKNHFLQHLLKHDIPCPKLYTDAVISKNSFPLFIKPAVGSSSKDSYRVDNMQELNYLKNKIDEISIQELLTGPEYTIDTMCDLEGNFVTCVIRERLGIKDGKAVKCKTVKDAALLANVKKLLTVIKIYGPSNIQCIKDKDDYKFFEINTRFSAGGLPLTTESGINLPIILVDLLLNKQIKKEKLDYKKNLYMSRYLTEIFIDDIHNEN